MADHTEKELAAMRLEVALNESIAEEWEADREICRLRQRMAIAHLQTQQLLPEWVEARNAALKELLGQ